MDRFNLISPLDFRYIRFDYELKTKIREYSSLDILLKFERIVPELVIPRLNLLETTLLSIAEKNNDKQIPRRVDGSYNGETTIGEIFTSYSNRLNRRIKDIENVSLDIKDLEEAKRNDTISDLVYFSLSAFSVEANIADDIRHLFRTEIAEFSHEEFGERIGSSTMPHKRNPAEYEQVKSLWKAFAPRIITALLSQITEHQGDSTNEYFPYYTFELVCTLSYTTKSLERALKNLRINV